MKAAAFNQKLEQVRAMAARMIENHRGDGLAQPALDLCNGILEGVEPDEAPEQPAKDDTKAAAKKPQ